MKNGEGISDYMIRLVRAIQFQEVSSEYVADRNAMAWYNKRKESGLFPTDSTIYQPKPKIRIIKINESSDA